MRQIAWKLSVLGGLLLATNVACADRTPARTTTPAPDAEIAPATIEAIEEPLTYTVVPGDFLSAIANRFEVSLEALIELNGIANAGLIEVGQELLIPGASIVVADPFSIEPAERWPEIYPPPALPAPVEPSPLQELRNRIAAWPWPPRSTMIDGGVIAGFAVTAILGGLVLTSVEYNTRRWAARAVPRGARRAFQWWGKAAVLPRHAYLAIRRRAIPTWRFTVVAANAIWAVVKALDRRYRRVRGVVIVSWVRTRVHRERIAEAAKPAIQRADQITGQAIDVARQRSQAVLETVRDRAPTSTDSFTGFGDRATAVRRSVASGAQRARRDVFEPAPPPERWRTRIAGELARAFERDQLEVRYVPVIDLDAHTLSAVEAHLYWQHPQRGLMIARDIHSATQDHPELGAALLEFLLEQSCAFVKERVDQRYPSAQLIVPITLEQIVESEPLAAIDRGLTTANLALDRLKVSIAERHALHDAATAAAFIRNLRSMGIGVHLDDYGMAAAEDLGRLGVSSVTVDFAAAGTSETARAMLSGVVQAAQDLRLPVTARHARTDVTRSLQASLGCTFEAVGEPLPADTFVSAHVDDQPATSVNAPTRRPMSRATTAAASPHEAVSTSALADVTREDTTPTTGLIELQTRRPAGPLRMTRPATDWSDASNSTGAEPTAELTSTSAVSDEAADDEPETIEGQTTDHARAASDGPNSSRPVDAA